LRAIGFADRLPIASNATSSGRAKSRRVDLLLSDANGQFGAAD
jgi:flagellar motor protein MotB